MDDIELEVHERRKYPRLGIKGTAKISIGAPEQLMPSVVLDWSHGGASLQMACSGRCPDSFILIGADDWFEECEVVWRRHDMLGVRFLKCEHPAILWVEAEARRQADADARMERRIRTILRRTTEAIASAAITASRRPNRKG